MIRETYKMMGALLLRLRAQDCHLSELGLQPRNTLYGKCQPALALLSLLSLRGTSLNPAIPSTPPKTEVPSPRLGESHESGEGDTM